MLYSLKHDLFGKPEVHPRIKSEGRLFPDHAQARRSATNFAASMRIVAPDPNGARACSASATSCCNRTFAASTPSTLTICGLACGGIFADRLADQGGIAFEIEQVVGNLECFSDCSAIAR